MSEPSQLTPLERSVLAHLVEHLFPESHPYRRQLQSVVVVDKYGSGDPTVALRVEDPAVEVGPDDAGQIASATSTDSDGGLIDVLVHVKDGKLSELELYRPDGETIRELPKAKTLVNIFNPKVGWED